MGKIRRMRQVTQEPLVRGGSGIGYYCRHRARDSDGEHNHAGKTGDRIVEANQVIEKESDEANETDANMELESQLMKP